jgi:hypothetical protein
MALQWIGVALTIFGMLVNGYQNLKTQTPPQPTPQAQIQSEKPHVLICQINIAYDINTGKHYFQHPNGQWFDYPPKPF